VDGCDLRRGGFFAGAVGGLAIALLLVGLVSVYPQANPPIPVSSTATTTQTTSCIYLNPETTCAFLATSNPVSGAANPQLNAPESVGVAPVAAASTGQAQPRPDSLLAVLPGESVGSLIATISPLLVALLIAGLVYGAYVRRQDASS